MVVTLLGPKQPVVCRTRPVVSVMLPQNTNSSFSVNRAMAARRSTSRRTTVGTMGDNGEMSKPNPKPDQKFSGPNRSPRTMRLASWM